MEAIQPTKGKTMSSKVYVISTDGDLGAGVVGVYGSARRCAQAAVSEYGPLVDWESSRHGQPAGGEVGDLPAPAQG